MGQSNSRRIHYEYSEPATPNFNGLVHSVSCTKHFRVGDAVDFVDVDANGNILSVLADNEVITAVIPNQAIHSTNAIAAGGAGVTGTLHIRPQPVDDVKVALDRLFCDPATGPGQFDRIEPLITNEYLGGVPSAGQTTLFVADTSFFSVGDTVYIYDDEGFDIGTYNVLAVNVNADDSNNRASIVIDSDIEATLVTASANVSIQNTSITAESAIKYLQTIQDELDKPLDEDLGVGNGVDCAFEISNLMVQSSSKLFIDGRRLKRGTAGTRASHTEGAGSSQLAFDAMLLGVLGNEIRVEVQAGAGLAVTVTKSYGASSSAILPASTDYLIQVEDQGGTATATDIANAINADAEAKRIVQVRTPGDGTGLVATFGPTALTGGLDDGTGDYAELEQLYFKALDNDQLNVNTGYKWVSLHMRPNERNRLSEPPADDEELCIDYRQARSNVDR